MRGNADASELGECVVNGLPPPDFLSAFPPPPCAESPGQQTAESAAFSRPVKACKGHPSASVSV